MTGAPRKLPPLQVDCRSLVDPKGTVVNVDRWVVVSRQILIVALFLPLLAGNQLATAQSKTVWKLLIERTAGGWSLRRGAEIDSNGFVVTHEYERSSMPRCGAVNEILLGWLSDSIQQTRAIAGEKRTVTYRGPRPMESGTSSATLIWPDEDKILTIRILGGELPVSVRVMMERAWRIADNAEESCRPLSHSG
jgi:hypothetical protein